MSQKVWMKHNQLNKSVASLFTGHLECLVWHLWSGKAQGSLLLYFSC